MKRFGYLLLGACWMGSVATAATVNETATARYFDSIQNDPQKLFHFLQAMPKGGDLHNHPSGSAYAENMLHYAANDQLCVNRQSYAVFKDADCLPQDNLMTAIQDAQFKDAIEDAWSMRHFDPEIKLGHDHFFATFSKFAPIASSHTGEIFAEIAKRAALQNELYLELLAMPDGNQSGRLGKSLGWDANLARFRTTLLASGLHDIVNAMTTKLDHDEANMRSILNCESDAEAPGCKIHIRYLYQTLREQSPEMVFAQLLAGFEWASKDPRIVGINMVQAEDGKISMRDYSLHMQMVGFLHELYPAVKITLHAGELSDAIVPPEGLTFHIREALETAHANRIGHGVDVAQETDADQLLKEMAAQHTLVEINLSSNKDVLNIEGQKHPLPLYLRYGVPIALSTDDEGINRSNLSKEYEHAVQNYHLSYPELKSIARNSIHYGFLPGQSLWLTSDYRQVVEECMKDETGSDSPSRACEAFLASNEKAAMEWALEKHFNAFETRYSAST